MIVRILILLLFISTSLFAQDSTKKDNKWFTEFQIANASGFSLDFVHGVDLAIGKRIFKNLDLRIVGGIGTSENNSSSNSSNSYSTSVSTSENNYDRYSTGIDIMYRIEIIRHLTFKIGLGYEYFFSKYLYKQHRVDDFNITYDIQSEEKDYTNRYKTIGSFSYYFIDNIYLFIQGYITYERLHSTQSEISKNNVSPENDNYNSVSYKSNQFRLDYFFLGGGITF